MPRRELARTLAVVPQEPVFSFPFTALEVVLMGRHPHLAGPGLRVRSGTSSWPTRALERCGGRTISRRARSRSCRPASASGSSSPRRWPSNPRMLLLDEPASFLDIRHQVELYDIVRELAVEHGCSVLTVLHDLNLAAEYCDRIYLLKEGRSRPEAPTARCSPTPT